jgi:SPX domain protein involved in polyphosphate accumulation
MKFGTTLRKSVYAPWKDQYVDYDKLKKLLRENDDDKQWTSDDVTRFTEELANVQLEKVYNFRREMSQKLRERLTACEKKLEPLAIGIKSEASADTENSPSYANVAAAKPEVQEEDKKKILNEVLAELDNITKEVKELETYSRINYTAVLKATKKHDKLRGRSYRLRPFLNARLAEKPIYTEDHSPLVYRLSALYAFVRQSLEGKPKEELSFSENSAKGEQSTSYKCKLLHVIALDCINTS